MIVQVKPFGAESRIFRAQQLSANQVDALQPLYPLCRMKGPLASTKMYLNKNTASTLRSYGKCNFFDVSPKYEAYKWYYECGTMIYFVSLQPHGVLSNGTNIISPSIIATMSDVDLLRRFPEIALVILQSISIWSNSSYTISCRRPTTPQTKHGILFCDEIRVDINHNSNWIYPDNIAADSIDDN